LNARFLKQGLKPLWWMQAKPLFFPQEFWVILYATGSVVIYANPSLKPEERVELEAMAGGATFDLER